MENYHSRQKLMNFKKPRQACKKEGRKETNAGSKKEPFLKMKIKD